VSHIRVQRIIMSRIWVQSIIVSHIRVQRLILPRIRGRHIIVARPCQPPPWQHVGKPKVESRLELPPLAAYWDDAGLGFRV
jgi:hypothetical protein